MLTTLCESHGHLRGTYRNTAEEQNSGTQKLVLVWDMKYVF